ncbi:MAG: GMP/IMP nucleotidase [Sedimenticola sp.]|uniref:GMP/IMP nucleotidase n=1 Tax=Sedimenticola thiotaurini TaxID=1543721 RepID=A0A558DAR9_9GAMM|nr:GMP/IMP nucleotidase [Sedimenticola sp.]TVT58127.1 MAG: GMP/IMP nucleotidase [Sedimenticola thiotaurini]MCW8946430.1 GMP/IMP nucleotidase [Sedimenticola sp.]MCW8948661.1 GMP/IMP nucleotidase [Sedimenticola sp.]MCW8975593.1 GMP/IMP nucleotidase [Sedimenticola sp.]
MIDWNQIDTILLDMDGTLLDLHFDNYFWLEHVPRRFAERQGCSINEAKDELAKRYRSVEGTLEWYCVDHWSRELGLDIALLKAEVDHLIAVHPHVIDFLKAVTALEKRVVLVTNAHQKALGLKMERTKLHGYFDAVICSHDLGLPKEHRGFWAKLQQVESFEKQRTLFVDDSQSVLESARDYGMGYLIRVLYPDTKGPVREPGGFVAIHDFSEILP